MPEFRSGLSQSLLLAALVAVAVLSMAVDGGRETGEGGEMSWFTGAILDVAAPVQKVLAMPVDFVRETFIDYVDLLMVREETLLCGDALGGCGRLQRIAEMRDAFEIPMLPSELVGVDASPWFRSALVDRGQVDGVRAGMPVISEQGLVGLVRATSTTAARTMLVVDRQSAIDGTVQRSRTRGLVRGRGTDQLEFEFVARGHDVEVGDLVMTSGLGGVYPKGLRMGEVVEILDPGSQLMQTALIEPAVDFGRLEQVFVMLRRGPTMELLYGAEDGDLAVAEAPDDPAS